MLILPHSLLLHHPSIPSPLHHRVRATDADAEAPRETAAAVSRSILFKVYVISAKIFAKHFRLIKLKNAIIRDERGGRNTCRSALDIQFGAWFTLSSIPRATCSSPSNLSYHPRLLARCSDEKSLRSPGCESRGEY